MVPISRHQCLIYDGSPAPHLPALVSVIQRKLTENHRCLYLNSPPMVAGLRSYLFAAGVDVPKEVMKGRLVLSSDTTHLENGTFDIDRMLDRLSAAVIQARDEGYQGLWATGDMSWEFGCEKNLPKLLEYEWRLEELFHTLPTLAGICQYHRDTLPAEIVRQGLVRHHSIFISDTLSRLNPHYVRGERFDTHLENTADLDSTISSLCNGHNQILN
jgi:MEDS: MEthanogen/methylotroph, DcmR Sensory domain